MSSKIKKISLTKAQEIVKNGLEKRFEILLPLTVKNLVGLGATKSVAQAFVTGIETKIKSGNIKNCGRISELELIERGIVAYSANGSKGFSFYHEVTGKADIEKILDTVGYCYCWDGENTSLVRGRTRYWGTVFMSLTHFLNRQLKNCLGLSSSRKSVKTIIADLWK